MIKAVFFDLDGVLVNACDWHYHSLNEALRNISDTEIERDEHMSTFNGLPTKKKLQLLSDNGRIKTEDHDKIWNEKQLLTEKVIQVHAKVDIDKQNLHKLLQKRGLILCCVTNSIRKTALLMLEKTGQLNFMKTVITNEDVVNPKPNSEGYQKAIDFFNLDSREVLIIEDSDKGYEAAIGTGAHVFRVKDPSFVNIKNVFNKIESLNKERKK